VKGEYLNDNRNLYRYASTSAQTSVYIAVSLGRAACTFFLASLCDKISEFYIMRTLKEWLDDSEVFPMGLSDEPGLGNISGIGGEGCSELAAAIVACLSPERLRQIQILVIFYLPTEVLRAAPSALWRSPMEHHQRQGFQSISRRRLVSDGSASLTVQSKKNG